MSTPDRSSSLSLVTFAALLGCSTPSSGSSAGAPVEVTIAATSAAPSGAVLAPPTSRTVASEAPILRPTGTAAPGKAQWACAAPAECVQTCALGAVSAAWLKANPNADACDDGCGWNTNQVTCKDGQCVTLDKSGNVDPSCSLRPYVPKP